MIFCDNLRYLIIRISYILAVIPKIHIIGLITFCGQLLGNHISLIIFIICGLRHYIWLLGTFLNGSRDIIFYLTMGPNCCRNLAVRGLSPQIKAYLISIF